MFRSGDFGPATRCIEVYRAQLGVDLRCRDTGGLQFCRVESDTNFATDPACAGDCGHSGHTKQTLGHGIVHVPTQLFQRHIARFGGKEADRIARYVDTRDLWLENSFGKITANIGDGIAYVVDSAVDRCADHELDEGAGASFADARIDFVDADDVAYGGFNLLRDLRF